MIPVVGEKVHIIERKYFPEDLQRHMVGEIIQSSESVLRIKGYVWIRDPIKGFVRKTGKRDRVVYPSDRTTINIIPKEVDIGDIKYLNVEKTLVVTDGKNFSLDITEFSR
jgi:G3E family GTPase